MYVSNSYLTTLEMTVNAQYILDFLLAKGWSKNSVCAMLGNMQTESTINAGIWESLDDSNINGGFGLVQWTPSTKYSDWAILNSLEVASIDSQLLRIIYEVENGLQWQSDSEYPMTFSEFIHSTESADTLAIIFLNNYENPADINQPIRGEQAMYWYTNLEGGSVNPTKKKKSMPLYMYRLF